MRIIEVVDYNPEWKDKFEEEKKNLAVILGRNAVDILHIGSTSVPGLKAKPTVDIMVMVNDLAEVDARNPEMEKSGYKAFGEYGIPGRRFFSKAEFVSDTDWVNIFHVHVFRLTDTNNTRRHIAVSEYLKSHRDRADEYGALKASLASEHGNDQDAYIRGKDYFVRKLQHDALEWYSDQLPSA